MKKKIIIIIAIICCNIVSVFAQNYVKELSLQTRIDCRNEFYNNDTISNDSRFEGKFLNLIMKGNINENLSYSFRQRLNRSNYNNNNLFKNTDFIYLNYNINDKFSFAFGKQVIYIGGFEYDYAPIDVYFWSDFWNNITCYAFASTLFYKINDDNTLLFQISNSPFSKEDLSNIYSYNFAWYGNFSFFKTIYSINMIEYKKGHFINYIALGNKIKLGKFDLDLDLMNRASTEQDDFFFKDYSIIGKLQFNANNKLNCFVKAGQDKNSAQKETTLTNNYYDLCVIPGTDYKFYGLGCEYYPLKENKDLRLHCFFYSNNNDIKQYNLNLGLTWNINIIKK